jgi:hypothetical protein
LVFARSNRALRTVELRSARRRLARFTDPPQSLQRPQDYQEAAGENGLSAQMEEATKLYN